MCAHNRHNSRVQGGGHLKLAKKDIKKHLFQVQLFINGPLAVLRPSPIASQSIIIRLWFNHNQTLSVYMFGETNVPEL